ncbi:hypothetical protein KAOT1_17128 [Kordia algicida OT-1]|uniref:Uncharacterized protein n=1 Tax=Kordia algicida OT-1 TaxID=391587 RepID=A9DSA5_9FLAO|nr:hypothetical protein KAOT1_17128 [Kordia algicida OT-1]
MKHIFDGKAQNDDDAKKYLQASFEIET